MKSNICLVGLARSYTKSVAKRASEKLGMFFGDLDDLMQFELIDVENARKLCGDNYINKVEEGKMKMLSSFENTLFTFNYNILNLEKNLDLVKEKSIIVFVSLNERNMANKLRRAGHKNSELKLELELRSARDKLCRKYADIVVDGNDKTIDKVIFEIKKSLYNKLVKE